jgi:hypothetical protein
VRDGARLALQRVARHALCGAQSVARKKFCSCARKKIFARAHCFRVTISL